MTQLRHLILLLCMSLAAVACGDDPASEGDGDAGDGQSGDGDDAGDGDSGDGDSGDGDSGDGDGDDAGDGDGDAGDGDGDGDGDSGDGDAGNGDALVSSLDEAEVQAFCEALEAVGEPDDLASECQIEAYLLTYDSEECQTTIDECMEAGATVLDVTFPIDCDAFETGADTCDETVDAVLACEKEVWDFLKSRTCETDSLLELLPDCFGDLQCDAYNGGDDGGGGGGGGSDGYCSGISESCYTQFSSFSCSDVDGCYWSYVDDDCSGVSRSCTGYFSSFSCDSQPGCYWVQ